MRADTVLLPRPRRVRLLPGLCRIKPRHPLVLLRHAASSHGDSWYKLRIEPGLIVLWSGAPSGQRYGLITLAQILRGNAGSVRAMEIEDWPDFPVRGVMLDISRDKVPTMTTLERLVDLLAGWKINQLQLYMEHTFAYRGHETVWRGCSPMTPKEIRRLDQLCRDRGIELVPNQNSFGHMEHWLAHEKYRPLAETTKPWKTPWGGYRDAPAALNPLDPQSLKLVTGLYDQLLPSFSSRLFNVGCDETLELGQGRSARECARRGRGRVYLDYLLKLRREVRKRGRRMMFWSDIVHEHPEVIQDLPKDLVALVWGYEADHPFAKQCAELSRRGLEFYVCPGTSSWCSFSGRSTNARENLLNAALAGLRSHAAGYLVTDWGDFGHRQYLPASYGPLLYGAAVSWCAKANANIDIGREVSRHVFRDAASPLGPGWFEAGRVHEPSGISLKNRTILFNLMQMPLDDIGPIRGLTLKKVAAMRRRIESLLRKTSRSRIVANPAHRSEGKLAREELLATLGVLLHACRRAELALSRPSRLHRNADLRLLQREMKAIIARHKKLWRMRNRSGGLSNSAKHYDRMLREYDELLTG